MKKLISKLNIKNETKLKKVLPVLLLLLLITIIIGVTYAALDLTEVGNENSITTGLVSMSYTESTNVIDIKNALPMSDVEGKTQDNYFDFSVTSNLTLNENDPDAKVSYSIEIEPIESNTLNDDNIKVYLEDITNNKVLIDSKLISSLSNYTLYSTSHDHKYNVNTVTTKYRLRAWIDYNTDASNWDSTNSYEYKFRVNVNGDIALEKVLPIDSAAGQIASQVKTTNISYEYINDANVTEYTMNENPTEEQISKCETYFIEDQSWWDYDNIGDFCKGGLDAKDNYYTMQMYLDNNWFYDSDLQYLSEIGIISKTGVVYNNGDNGVFLYDGTDDNGGSYPIYYYRGNVDNNNVIFGGFCWKIVRTTSTGGTKLIYNGVPTNGTCNNTGEASQLSSKGGFSEGMMLTDLGYMNGTTYKYSSIYSPSKTIIYGSDVTYSDGTYTLVDTTKSTDDSTTIWKKYRYTCLNDTGICDEVYYIMYFEPDRLACILINDGNNFEGAKEKMFSNINDSKIKVIVDDWYSTYLSNYTNILENTIFCNDRSFDNEFSYDGVAYIKFEAIKRFGTPSLQCVNKNDRFSLSTNSGGTSGYGNNKLTYPVSLLTADEANLAGGQYSSNGNYYLYTGSEYKLMTPLRYVEYGIGIFHICADGTVSSSLNSYLGADASDNSGIRPVISLKLGTKFTSGTTGTTTNPYVVVTE